MVKKKASYTVASISVFGRFRAADDSLKNYYCRKVKTKRKSLCGRIYFALFWLRSKRILFRMH